MVRARTITAAALSMAVLAGMPAAAQGEAVKDHPWGKRVAAAERYAEKRAGSVSFAVRAAGVKRARGGLRTYASASIVKVMLQTIYLRRASERELSRDERKLLKAMIRRSHDGSATWVRDRVGNSALEDLAAKVGMRRFATATSWGSTRVCARDMALLMWKVEALTPKRHRGFAMRNLSRIVPRQRWAIPEVTGWTPYFKGGWYPDPGGWRTHQIALLREPGKGAREISLAVLTSGQPSRNYGRATVRGVAKRLIGPLTR